MGHFVDQDDASLVFDRQLSIGSLKHLHLHSGIAGPLLDRHWLHGTPSELDGVVLVYLATLLEGQGLFRCLKFRCGWLDSSLGPQGGLRIERPTGRNSNYPAQIRSPVWSRVCHLGSSSIAMRIYANSF